MKALTATLRLQLHRGFTLDHATEWVDYFASLGISHIYASPLLTARPGSMHGYDVIDPTQINPELGGQAALERLVAALRERGMGLLLDIVSNHMAVGGAGNAWWLDVLEWGRHSPYAHFFDIEWNSADPLLDGQLLVPFLGSDYGEALQQGQITLQFDSQHGKLFAQHYEHHFPLTPASYGEVLRAADDPALKALAQHFDALKTAPAPYSAAQALQAELTEQLTQPECQHALTRGLHCYDTATPEGFKRLHSLLERQHYRLASWRTAADDINWRRFFDINELGGLRVERPSVFEKTHEKIFELLRLGLVDGLRIDHVDGLADPRRYCRRLRRCVNQLNTQRPAAMRLAHIPIYVEKILGQGEQLHHDWNVDGTTGYEFMNQISLLQHDPAGKQSMQTLWHELTGRTTDFLEEARQARQWILTGPLAGDFESVAQALLQIARSDVMTRDITLGAIRRALLELIIHFPIYRTYISAVGRPAQDEPFFQQAIAGARSALNEADGPLLEHLQRWLGGENLRQVPKGAARKARRYACTRFQQLTSPAAAKAVEDTACYRSAVALARNDVGFDPQAFSAAPQHFHHACQQRAEYFPLNLLTTATHDHKRGEDVRARLAVLSERADWFANQVRHWQILAEPLRQRQPEGDAPTPADQLLLIQTLLGSWPLDLSADDNKGLQQYAQRIQQWQEKAIREAKLRTSWSVPNNAYENACQHYTSQLLTSEHGHSLRQELAAAAHELSVAGAVNSLSQTLLRMTTPGVPDLYQGNEFWDFSLVDPDNRRPIDFARRQQTLAATPEPNELLSNWRDGRIKQWLINQTLHLRQQLPQLFTQGRYLPLTVTGEHHDKLLVFAREHNDQWALVIVPRLSASLLGDSPVPHIPAARWSDTCIQLPPALVGVSLHALFGHASLQVEYIRLRAALVLENLPLAVFYTKT